MIEYKVKPVTRFVITRFHRYELEGGQEVAGVDTIGEYDNENQAGMVAGLMAHSECADVDPKWRVNSPDIGIDPGTFDSAICELANKAEMLENNAPIHAAEGSAEQAKHCAEVASSCRQAIAFLRRLH
jgi:hypothetical protein